MKTILLLIHDDDGQAARIAAAVATARVLDASLHCLDVVQIPHVISDYFSQAGRSMLLSDEEHRENANRQRVQHYLEQEGIRYSWSDATGDMETCVAQATDLADLVVLTREEVDPLGFGFRPIVLRAALKSKPLLSLPSGVLDFNPAGRAMIAWDESNNAMSVLRACVPLLQKASAAELFTVTTAGRAISGFEAAQYLSRHDVHCTIASQPSAEHDVDEWLRIQASIWRADYCVMGAFGDSHLRHFLFGSTTRQMLGRCDIPIILGR